MRMCKALGTPASHRFSAGGPRIRRNATVFVFVCLVAVSSSSAPTALDDAVARLPLDRWLEQKARPQIRWSVRTRDPYLSYHQRLLMPLQIVVPGTEAFRRRGKGPLRLRRYADPRTLLRIQVRGTTARSKD